MENNVITDLSEMAKGMLYFSESESPFLINNWNHIPLTSLTAEIAAKHSVAISQLRTIEPKAFFERLLTNVDPADQPMVENARKIRVFYDYIQQHLSNLQVTRVEGTARIPIVITGYTPDGHCIAVQTQAIET